MGRKEEGAGKIRVDIFFEGICWPLKGELLNLESLLFMVTLHHLFYKRQILPLNKNLKT
jgi:hypothetical protein